MRPRLKAFTAQISIGLENAKLFDDVQKTKNYVESILESMSNGVVTLDEDKKIVTCNAAGLRILRTSSEEIIGREGSDFFTDSNNWVVEKIDHVEKEQKLDVTMDAELEVGDEKGLGQRHGSPLGQHQGSQTRLHDIDRGHHQ